MINDNLYVEAHVLQPVPSSNINRDDSGSPKTAIYGGVLRSRVSSQSWKHAMRMDFQAHSEGADWLKGHRTKRLAYVLAPKLSEKDTSLDEEAALSKAFDVLKAAGIKATSKDKKSGEDLTDALFLISNGELEKLAEYATNNEKDNWDKKELKEVISRNQSLDLALFGRMMAGNPELGVDASAQVAHAISTHEIVPEFDFFTGLDDDKPENQSGSSFLEALGYNSSTLYRYANVNLNELVHNLGSDLAVEGVKQFIKSFITSMPTGKQNSFANKTLPQYVMVTVRKDTPVNLVSAFEEPIKSRNGYVEPSIEHLENEFNDSLQFVEEPLLTAIVTKKQNKIDKKVANLNELLEKVSEVLRKEVADESNNN